MGGLTINSLLWSMLGVEVVEVVSCLVSAWSFVSEMTILHVADASSAFSSQGPVFTALDF